MFKYEAWQDGKALWSLWGVGGQMEVGTGQRNVEKGELLPIYLQSILAMCSSF